MAILFSGLLLMLTAYGMLVGNQALLRQVLRMVEYGFALLGLWAIGSTGFRALVRRDHLDD